MPTEPKSPPRVVVVEQTEVEPTGVYIKVPGLSPEVGEMISGHLDRGSKMASLLGGVVGSLLALAELATAERKALATTTRKLSKKPRRRK